MSTVTVQVVGFAGVAAGTYGLSITGLLKGAQNSGAGAASRPQSNQFQNLHDPHIRTGELEW